MSLEASTTVLVIDERPELRRRVTAVLEGTGVTVYDVVSPLGATSLISRLQVDVLVVGARITGASGRSFAQLLRNSPRLRHVKTILLLPELPGQLERSRDFADVDAVLEEEDIEVSLRPTLKRLTRRRRATPTSGPVLLVDSDEERRERLRDALLEIGHVVHECSRGTGALARALETRPKSIVVALDLVDLPATELVEMLRTNRTTGASRIFLFGDREIEDVESIRTSCGANGVLHPDSEKAELRDRLLADSATI